MTKRSDNAGGKCDEQEERIMREKGERWRALDGVCAMLLTMQVLCPSPPSIDTSLTHTSAAESWLWAPPHYCREKPVAASMRGLCVR